MTVHFPPDKTVMEFGLLNAAVSVSDEFTGDIIVFVNGLKEKEITRGREMKCFTVPIQPGINEISIVAREGKIEIERRSFSVFRRSDLLREFSKPPREFRKVYFHESKWKQCSGCHVMEPTEADKKPVITRAPSGEASGKPASTCYSCHQAILSYSYVHGPVSVWACLSCHETDAVPCYSVKKPESKTCYTCHVEQQNEWTSKKYIHGPVNTGQCSICHNPHASDYPSFLGERTWNLCVTCHVDMGSGRHVLADAYSKKGHPTRDRPDPVRTGKELTCASCHNPHASDYPRLWAFGVESIFELCKKCHEK